MNPTKQTLLYLGSGYFSSGPVVYFTPPLTLGQRLRLQQEA